MRPLHSAALALAALLATCAGTRADLITLSFDELAQDTPADGASVRGLRFSFAGANPGDAFYNSSTLAVGPADATLLSGSVLEGDSAGVLTIDFVVPTTLLRFAVLLSSVDALSPGFTVELFDASLASLGTTGVLTAPLVSTGFSEGLFERLDGPLVSRAVIDFSDAPGRFALDNLQAVPEPGALALCVVGASALAGYAARRRARARG